MPEGNNNTTTDDISVEIEVPPQPIETTEPQPGTTCDICQEEDIENGTLVHGQTRCENCRNDMTCSSCGHEASHQDDINEVDGQMYCRDCSFYCDSHDGYEVGEANYSRNDSVICDNCLTEYYELCQECDRYDYREDMANIVTDPDYIDDESYLCDDCLQGGEYMYNQFLGVSTPRGDSIAEVISGTTATHILDDIVETMLRNSTGPAIPQIPTNAFMYAQVNPSFMQGVHQMVRSCPTGHTTIIDAINPTPETTEEHYCQHCRYVLTKFKTLRDQQKKNGVLPDYTKIQGYHAHSYSDKDFLQMAEDKKKELGMYFGIELETSFSTDHVSGMNGELRARHVLAELKGTFVGERDGTVPNGAELISKPMTYNYLTSKTMLKRLQSAMDKMRELGAMNGVHPGIGLHIHVSRYPFKSETKATVEMEDDMNWFVNCFKDYVEVISRRKETNYCKFPMSHIQKPANLSRVFVDKKTLQKGSHGFALNLAQHRTPTYEFRVFNSTQDVKQLIASIEFVRNLSLFAINEPTIIGKTFKDIVDYKPTMFLGKLVRQAARDYPQQMRGWNTRRLKEELEIN